MKLYKIEACLKHGDKWIAMPSFSCMRKSFADGAWAMLRANYGGLMKYRLVIDKKGPVEIIDEWNSPEVRVNSIKIPL